VVEDSVMYSGDAVAFEETLHLQLWSDSAWRSAGKIEFSSETSGLELLSDGYLGDWTTSGRDADGALLWHEAGGGFIVFSGSPCFEGVSVAECCAGKVDAGKGFWDTVRSVNMYLCNLGTLGLAAGGRLCSTADGPAGVASEWARDEAYHACLQDPEGGSEDENLP
jgi:hypothetical protein